MKFAFWKMHGTGNDFVLMESDLPDANWPALARRICDRHFGVGADGLIVALPSHVADRRMRIFNPDGSEAEMCGNGIRCFVKYMLDRGAVSGAGTTLRIETAVGVLEALARLDAAGRVESARVAMGAPRLQPEAVGVANPTEGSFLQLVVAESPAMAVGKGLALTLISMGNPHAVQFTEDSPGAFDLEHIGPAVEHDALFANRTNFEIVRVHDRAHLEMRVWERGAGATLACGTGACAAVVAARLRGIVGDDVEVALPGGTLHITWDGVGEVYLEGPATCVFEATWEDAS